MLILLRIADEDATAPIPVTYRYGVVALEIVVKAITSPVDAVLERRAV